jgi:hypothetical protein
VHLRAKRQAGGVRITFIRRSRLGGDSWEIFEVPLGEEIERYLLEVLDGDVVRRSVELSSPEYSYSPADELIDFGAQQSVLRLRVRQISREVGAGAALVANTPVR